MATLKDIVDEIALEATAIDSLFRHKEKFLMFKYGHEGLRKLNLTFAQGVRGMSVRVPTSCKIFLPSDYQSFIRVYLLGCDGKTIEISRNMNVPSDLFHYLYSCDGSLLTNEKGEELYDDCIQCDNLSPSSSCTTCFGKGTYIPLHLRELHNDIINYKDSWVKNHDQEKAIEFSSDLEDAAVIIEYMSNNYRNLSECQINVPYDYEECLEYYIKYKLLESGRETLNDALYFQNLFKNRRKVVLDKQNPLTIEILNDFYKFL